MCLVSRPGTYSFFLETELCTEVSPSGRQLVLALHLGNAFYLFAPRCCSVVILPLISTALTLSFFFPNP